MRTSDIPKSMETSTAPSALAPAEPPIPRHIVITHAPDTSELAKDDSNSGRPPRLPRPSLAKNLPLVDEIDLRDCLVSPTTPWRAAAIQGAVIGKEQLEVICNHGGGGGGEGYHACPCCRRFVQNEGGNANAPSQEGNKGDLEESKEAELQRSDSGGGLATLWSSLTMQSSMAAPPLSAGDEIQSYTVTETVVQGWLYKKGTGDDWAGRRWWKPRWVTLALAKSPTKIVPTPCLIAHRAPGVPYPASVLEMTSSTVVMAIERTHEDATSNVSKEEAKEEEWNRHCFQIVQNHSDEGKAASRIRIFTAPLDERNEWVFALNNALLGYEKRLSKARCAESQNAQKGRRAGIDATAVSDGLGLVERKQMRGRVRSPSPVRRMPGGLPPTSPRRGVRSPSPVRTSEPRPVDASSSPVTPTLEPIDACLPVGMECW
ncbi:hypothetical protein ACHAXT_012225 [Thalassiosira profunda]